MVLWAVAALAAAHLGRTEQYSPAPAHFAGGPLFEPWARWDASWYRTIVEQGYVYYPGVQSSVAFWPSYPMAMRLFEGVSPSPFVTGSLLTLVSGLACAVLFYAWCVAAWLGAPPPRRCCCSCCSRSRGTCTERSTPTPFVWP